MIHCAVFDFDGTLVDSNAIKRDSFLAVAGELPGGVDVMTGVLDKLTDANRYQVFDRFVADMHIPAARQLLLSQEMASRYSALCHSAISTAAEIPGALAVLQHLVARGVSLFVSSATPVEPLRELISARGWQGIFRNVYGSPAAKAAHVRQILREGQWRPQELVYVGDSDVDAVAARETGCCFIAVCLDRASGRFAARPVNCIGTLLELPEMIGRLPLQAP